jgi:hypothetical protein
VITTTCEELQHIETGSEFQNILLGMLNQAGDVETAATPPPRIPDSLSYNLDLGWLNDPMLSQPVRSRLDSIFNNFRPHDIYYVGEALYSKNPTFETDSLYYTDPAGYLVDPNEQYPVMPKRYLALCRYWNIINYFHPHIDIMDQQWDSTLVEFIPRFIEAEYKIDFHLSMLELAARLNDGHGYTHSRTISDFFGYYFMPIVFDYIDGQTVVTRILDRANINTDVDPGDIVLEIAGKNVAALRDSLRPYVSASNSAALEQRINERLIQGPYGNVTLLVETEKNGTKEVQLKRSFSNDCYYSHLWNRGVQKWRKIETQGGEYGYVHMGRLTIEDIPNMFRDLWDCPAIIFDIRNYPNLTLWYMIRYLFDEPIYPARFTQPDIHYPGTFFWRDASEVGMGDFSQTYHGYMVLLFDKNTISQAEYTCMGLEQHPKSIKIGSQTAGADGNVSYIYLPGGIRTLFSGLGVYYPDGTPTQRVGIIPDFEVHPTIQGYRDEIDEVLEFAVEHLNTLLSTPVFADQSPTPFAFQLEQNYPNPFNLSTSIDYEIRQAGRVQISIFNAGGQRIRILVNQNQPAGRYSVLWNALDDTGRSVSSGVYVYKLQVFQQADQKAIFQKSRKMVLIR